MLQDAFPDRGSNEPATELLPLNCPVGPVGLLLPAWARSGALEARGSNETHKAIEMRRKEVTKHKETHT